MKLIEHLEERLGAIRHGWSYNESGRPMPFKVACLGDGPMPDIDSYATVGLSQTDLISRTSGRIIHQEIFISVDSKYTDGPYPGILQQIGLELIREDEALLRGDVIGPRDPILPGSKIEAFYAAIPVYYDKEFAAVRIEGGVEVVITWLVPITRKEAEFVSRQGWERFEDEVVRHDPEFHDLFRDEIPLPEN
ncbi:suppressor of fused domain protein [Streptomyces botrytidirepellens]|uniref:Suppressor of fused domain protein n=1 Tax=Streptomyces botrytidirepellens TaxID=2486417 RepID=A0A3M8VSP4_9ACTN|nr:suppressor of fused domain protein [Streptomyces botrytidirepellens]RNG19599.1 suppressor of fused domain protein [Streptomyces botrytidirepellens]